MTPKPDQTPARESLWTIFLVYLRLGLTSFGGPTAHFGYYREAFVERQRWIDDGHFGDLMALCQFLPGATSTQFGVAVATGLRGPLGGVIAFAAFVLPSAALMIAAAFGVVALAAVSELDALGGLLIAAAAVVARALWGMARTLCPDRTTATVAGLAAVCSLIWPGPLGQLAAIAAGGLIGWQFVDRPVADRPVPVSSGVGRRFAILCLAALAVLLIGLPIAAGLVGGAALDQLDALVRSGALVFGGGHVVLPLLHAEFVLPGWVDDGAFTAGYGAAQALPGPIFTFAGFLGVLSGLPPGGIGGGLLALGALFVPSLLMLWGVLPFWSLLVRLPAMRSALAGVNGAVVGLLGAAFYSLIWTSAIHTASDLAMAVVAFVALSFWRAPPWLVVAACAAAGLL